MTRLRRIRPIDCFFCHHPSTTPSRHKHVNWQCTQCGCWNIKDKHGEMVHDLPAMHNPQLNTHSFSLRARPSSSHLPSTTTASPFCHSCSANQTLIMNMMANYLPEDNDPSFPALYNALPTYISNLHSRYPPVCSDCQPAVDAALRKSDMRAQTEAWGSALTRGTRLATPSPVSWVEVLVWRIRGLLFGLGCALSWTRGLLAASHLLHLPIPSFDGSRTPQVILAFHLLSISWIGWDPYRLSRVNSRDHADGRPRWIKLMLLVLLLRLVTSIVDISIHSSARFHLDTLFTITLMLEVLLFIAAFSSIRTARGVPLRLVRPIPVQDTPRKSPGPLTSPPPLDALSLTENPVKPRNHVFGQASFSPPDDPIEMMDWEPTPTTRSSPGSQGHKRSSSDWDCFATGKQSMFPKRTQETGLESLIADWGISGPPEPRTREAPGQCIIA